MNLSGNINLINTGISIANDVNNFLIEHNIKGNLEEETKPEILITKDVLDFNQKANSILNLAFTIKML